MTETTVITQAAFMLPPSIVTRVDISRLVTEAERIDNELTTAAVRAKAGAASIATPAMSEQLESFLRLNQLTLSDSRQRTELITQLRQLKDKVPVIHMTFAVEADRESLGKIVAWLREQIHQQAVISVGLQPALVAGVYVRTPNHVHDFSLKAQLQGSRDLLIKELEATRG
jgi:F0F1-type ATP synthase delta subunit